jgi:DNA replication protein DnaC
LNAENDFEKMSIKKVLPFENRAILICPDCGSEFSLEYNPKSADNDLVIFAYQHTICDKCAKARADKAEAERKAEEAERKNRWIDEAMEDAGFKGMFQKLEKPVIRSSAEWIYRNRNSSLLISGETGTGKTSGVAFVIRYMLKDDIDLNVMYRTWQMLMVEFLNAKTSGGDNEIRFWARIDSVDYLIIDELVGRRGDNVKLTPSGHELLFNLVDGVYAGFRKTKVWILGNFYDGAIDKMMDDPLPTKRRIQEAFKIAWFDHDKQVDETIQIFNIHRTKTAGE